MPEAANAEAITKIKAFCLALQQPGFISQRFWMGDILFSAEWTCEPDGTRKKCTITLEIPDTEAFKP